MWMFNVDVYVFVYVCVRLYIVYTCLILTCSTAGFASRSALMKHPISPLGCGLWMFIHVFVYTHVCVCVCVCVFVVVYICVCVYICNV